MGILIPRRLLDAQDNSIIEAPKANKQTNDNYKDKPYLQLVPERVFQSS